MGKGKRSRRKVTTLTRQNGYKNVIPSCYCSHASSEAEEVVVRERIGFLGVVNGDGGNFALELEID